jgi:hypothetical protein
VPQVGVHLASADSSLASSAYVSAAFSDKEVHPVRFSISGLYLVDASGVYMANVRFI